MQSMSQALAGNHTLFITTNHGHPGAVESLDMLLGISLWHTRTSARPAWGMELASALQQVNSACSTRHIRSSIPRGRALTIKQDTADWRTGST